MSCKRYIKKLHLYAPGELSAGERKALERHLSRCDRCTELRLEIEKTGHIIELVRHSTPEIRDPEDLTGKVMNRIAAGRMERPGVLGRAVDALGVLLFPQTRPALVAMILFIVLGFFIQESMNMYRISQLEKKMEQQSKQLSVTSFEKRMEAFGFREVEQVMAVFQEENAVDVSDEWILVRRESLDALLLSYGRFLQGNADLLKELQKKDPELARILNKGKFSDLLENKKEIIRYIDKL